ncbi:MAG: heavy-metal-associated domain-containing protein [Proteobacteria bacterium]|nr:heavy-metal-associated domain-containing protein [Pseudomonadota bacterium]
MQTATLKIDGMSCSGCVGSVTRALTQLDGVADVNVTLEPPQATVTFDQQHVEIASLIAAIEDAGYDVRT